MAPEFDMKKVATPLLLHLLDKELRLPRLFLLLRRLSLNGSRRRQRTRGRV